MTDAPSDDPMILETREVGRKTPLDGKLEIARETAGRLTSLGSSFAVRVADDETRGALSELPCTCAKGPGSRHVHFFIQCELFRQLKLGQSVRLSLLAGSLLVEVQSQAL
jgi:hypothetical protein